MIHSETDVTYFVVPSHVAFSGLTWPDIVAACSARPQIRLFCESDSNRTHFNGRFGNGVLAAVSGKEMHCVNSLSEYGNVGNSCGLPRQDTTHLGLNVYVLEPFSGARGKIHGARSVKPWRVVVTPEHVPNLGSRMFLAIVQDRSIPEKALSAVQESLTGFDFRIELLPNFPQEVAVGTQAWYSTNTQRATWLELFHSSQSLGFLYSAVAYTGFHTRGIFSGMKSMHFVATIESEVQLRKDWIRK